ncbi:restriction endonuclease subunit R, partial [Burkholderia pseudomallei]|nr:restriction endonuclease subunit R [Burkholderia pseudomallei]
NTGIRCSSASWGHEAVYKRRVARRTGRTADRRTPSALGRDAYGKAVCLGDAFRARWDRIRHRATYRVNFDSARLIERCVAALKAPPAVTRARLQWRKADIAIDASGAEATETQDAGAIAIDEGEVELPDLLTDLQDRPHLTRRPIANLLNESGRPDAFPLNPHRLTGL